MRLFGEFSTKYADDCVHGRTNFMTHGGQETGLGPAGAVSLTLGFLQLVHQLAVFADVQPAADNALDDALAVVERLYPMADGHGFALQFNDLHRLVDLTVG